MTALAERLKEKYFGSEPHPYVLFEERVGSVLQGHHTLLDVGCGRAAPALAKFRGKAHTLLGVDLVDFTLVAEDLHLHKGDADDTGLPGASVDVVMARSVMEHLVNPAGVYREMHRVLKPGGHFVFLTPNLWEYSALIAKVVPNRLHPWLVASTQGREEHDVFPVQYKTNTQGAVSRFAAENGFDVESFSYLGQYPCYFMFNGFLFLLATGYEKLVTRFEALRFLRGWILVTLRKR